MISRSITTSAGTQGIINAKNADEIITGSFVNVNAIINYIKLLNPDSVSLVAMGMGGIKSSVEDTLCAQYIKDGLKGKLNNFEDMKETIKSSKEARIFFDARDSFFRVDLIVNHEKCLDRKINNKK